MTRLRTRWTLHRARTAFVREQLARLDGMSRLDREHAAVSA